MTVLTGDVRTDNWVKLGKPSQVGGRGFKIYLVFPTCFFLRRRGGVLNVQKVLSVLSFLNIMSILRVLRFLRFMLVLLVLF